MVPKTETLLQRLERIARDKKLEKFSAESLAWFRSKAQNISRAEARKTLLSGKGLKTISAMPKIGSMISYRYDPKHKDKLPYYDTFPLGFVVDIKSDGFFMLNLHYLPPKLRAVLFDKLIQYKNRSTRTDKVKLQITYSILKGASKLSLFMPCFKRYLFTHVRSRIVEIPSDQWEIAMFLPIAEFKKASNSQVWSDSAGFV